MAEAVGKQGHDGEQAEQAWCGAGNRLVGPLPLGLDAEVVTDLSEGDLQLPALREPAEDLQRLLRQVGAEQGLWIEAPAGIAQQHPADRHDRQAGMTPDGGVGADLHHTLALAVPVGHGDAWPDRPAPWPGSAGARPWCGADRGSWADAAGPACRERHRGAAG